LALAVGDRPEESQPAVKCRGRVGPGIARNEPRPPNGGREAMPVEVKRRLAKTTRHRLRDESSQRHKSELGVKTRPGRSGLAALQILHMCPLLPVDAFRHIAGFRSIGGAYRRLEKLRRAGLAEMQRAELGYLLADRPLGLWSITERGQRLAGR
jgi:hypothetical protein